MRVFDEADRRAVTALRVLAVDQVEQARSGHPGLPLGAAPMAYVLWSRFLRHDPADPGWPDRDRFVLSAGHGSAMLYALLHLFGYDLPIEELKRFRQWESRTPGHPEHGLTPGVEVTTGPLGQGFAAAVGMALAERHLAARFNREGLPLVDHRTWVIASDGDLMEGISHEAASIAGHLRSAAWWCSTTTTTSRSRGPPSSRSRRTWASASAGTGGASSTWRAATTSTPSRGRCGGPRGARTGPRWCASAPTSASAAPSRTTRRCTARRSARKPRRRRAGRWAGRSRSLS